MAIFDKNEKMLEDLKAIKKDIKEKKLKPFYFLYGDEDYFIDEIESSIKKTFVDDTGLNTKLYTEDNIDIEECIKYVKNYPLMNDKKLIHFSDIAFFKNNKKESKSNIEALISAFDESKDQNIILVTMRDSRDKDSRYIKNYGNENKLASFFKENGILVDLHKLDDVTISKYIASRFTKAKKTIDKVESAYIIRNCGSNLKNIYNECDKIISYMGDKEKVERIDIDIVMTRNVEDNVFNLMNLVNNNKIEEATILYGDLLSTGIKSSEMFSILANNYKNLLIAKDYMDKAKGQNEIAKLMGIESWQANRLVTANKYTTKESLVNKLDRITTLSIERFAYNLPEDLMFELLYFK